MDFQLGQSIQLIHAQGNEWVDAQLDGSKALWTAGKPSDSSLIALPPMVDLSFRFNSRNSSVSRSRQLKESQAAAKRGFGHLALQPDTSPCIDTPAEAEAYAEILPQAARVHPLGALTQGLLGEHIATMDALEQAGCLAFSMADQPLNSTQVLRNAFLYAQSRQKRIFLHPVDGYLAQGAQVHLGPMADILGLAAIPASAETSQVARLIHLAEETGVSLHLQHITSVKSLSLIAQAKAEGLPITADVDITHLFLTDKDVQGFATCAKVWPVLRSQRDQDALRQALSDGTLDAIVSNHTPASNDAKNQPFAQARFGASTLDVFLSLGAKLVLDGVITWNHWVALTSVNPAKILGLHPQSVQLRQDQFTLLDTQAWWPVTPDNLLSMGPNNPFIQWELPGVIQQVWREGARLV